MNKEGSFLKWLLTLGLSCKWSITFIHLASFVSFPFHSYSQNRRTGLCDSHDYWGFFCSNSSRPHGSDIGLHFQEGEDQWILQSCKLAETTSIKIKVTTDFLEAQQTDNVCVPLSLQWPSVSFRVRHIDFSCLAKSCTLTRMLFFVTKGFCNKGDSMWG